MNIAVLGHGIEGQAVETFFKEHPINNQQNHITFFENFKDSDIPDFHLEQFDLIFRSPSVHPQFILEESYRGLSKNWTSITNYFFNHCKAPIIGVTGTKGKGTTCSLITSILQQFPERFRKIHLVGNIGVPAILELDKIQKDDLVVYEMSSFQCWDLQKSPSVAVILRIEPDHLDRHLDFNDYLDAKSNLIVHQTTSDYCIYYANNQFSTQIAKRSLGKKIAYPIAFSAPDFSSEIKDLLNHLNIPGEHNRENAEAAILTTLSILDLQLADLFNPKNHSIYQKIAHGITSFTGLPHRIQFIRELNHVRYYDDNYSSAFPASDVAIRAFEAYPTILIAGGKDRHLDLTAMKERFFNTKSLKKIILIGENKKQLSENEDPEKYYLADSLDEAVLAAKTFAEQYAEELSSNYDLCIPSTPEAKQNQSAKPVIVLMSPGAASFDMFKDFNDRGNKFQELVNSF